MIADAYVVVNPVRRKRSITVRWTPTYILGRFLLILGTAGRPVSREHLIHAFTLLDHPRSLYDQIQVLDPTLFDEALLPTDLRETLSHSLPISTPKYDQALSLGLAHGLITAERMGHLLLFRAGVNGMSLCKELVQVEPLDGRRAQLALDLVDKVSSIQPKN